MGHSVEERIEMLKAYARTDAKYAQLYKEALVLDLVDQLIFHNEPPVA